LLLDANKKTNLADLLDETGRRHKELNQPAPPVFFLYVDQGEEIYVRAEERQRRRFSELLAQGLADPRLRALMSIRSDFLGALQGDEPLFDARRQIDVPPAASGTSPTFGTTIWASVSGGKNPTRVSPWTQDVKR
jgi:hypothetical protein